MEMHQVRYFLALCEELNFTRAAERWHVAQPSLTRAIKQLEEELGGALFHRERANTHLTELGRTLKPYLEQVFGRAEQAKREAQEFVRLQKTPLRLGLMCTIAPTYLLDLVAAVRTRHPGIELQIIDAAAAQLQERLIAGGLDVAIYALAELAPTSGCTISRSTASSSEIVLSPSTALPRTRRAREGPRRRALSLARQLRMVTAGRRGLRRTGRQRSDRLPERARRLDPRDGGGRPRLCVHAGAERRPPGRGGARRWSSRKSGARSRWSRCAGARIRRASARWCRRRCGCPGSEGRRSRRGGKRFIVVKALPVE